MLERLLILINEIVYLKKVLLDLVSSNDMFSRSVGTNAAAVISNPPSIMPRQSSVPIQSSSITSTNFTSE